MVGPPSDALRPRPAAAAAIKFLCSYGGKILPRHPDGKLRYVGGETRVLAVDRSISFSDSLKSLVMAGMRWKEPVVVPRSNKPAVAIESNCQFELGALSGGPLAKRPSQLKTTDIDIWRCSS